MKILKLRYDILLRLQMIEMMTEKMTEETIADLVKKMTGDDTGFSP